MVLMQLYVNRICIPSVNEKLPVKVKVGNDQEMVQSEKKFSL